MATDPYGLLASGLPPEIAAEAMGLQSKQAIIKALLAQSQQPLQAPEVKGRFSVPINPLQGFAKLAQAYVGAKGLEDNQQAQAELGSRYQKGVDTAMADYIKQRSGTPAQAPATPVDDEGNPNPQVAGTPGDPRKAIEQAMTNKYINKSPLITADLAAMEKNNVPFTLAPESTRYGADGKPIVTAPEKKTSGKPIVVTDNAGNTKLVDNNGNVIKNLGAVGKPTATYEKAENAKKQMEKDLAAVIPNLEAISKDGGLLDQSTGSGAGALVDMGASFFGKATPGSIAVGKLKPMVDPVLKLVPRFEGPQSDKDTASYKEAAGDLANPNVPNAKKKAAAKVILDIYRKRQGQFSTKDYEAEKPESPSKVRTVDW